MMAMWLLLMIGAALGSETNDSFTLTSVESFLDSHNKEDYPTLVHYTNGISEDASEEVFTEENEVSEEQNETMTEMPPPHPLFYPQYPSEKPSEELESRALTSDEEMAETTEEPVFTSSFQPLGVQEVSSSEGPTSIEQEDNEEDPTVNRSIVQQAGLNEHYLRQLDQNYQSKVKTSTTTEETIVTLAPTTPVSTRPTPKRKTMKSYNSKPTDVLRKFVENQYLRRPLACIVETTTETLRKAQILWGATLEDNVPLDMILAGYNATGRGAIYTFKNSRQFLTGLNNLRESPRLPGISRGFSATLETSDLIPFDSAIFLCTDQPTSDTNQYVRVANLLIKKRIRFYLVWFGASAVVENEAAQSKTGGLLGELALNSGGEILHIPNIHNDENLGVVTLFARRGINDVYDLTDSTVTAYHTPKPLPEPQTATEYTLNGD